MLYKCLTKASESSILRRSGLVSGWSLNDVRDLIRRSGSKGFSKSIGFIIRFTGCCLSWVKTPPGLKGLFDLLRCGELQDASFLRDNGALVFRGQAGDKLGDVSAGLLWVQVTNLFGNINN